MSRKQKQRKILKRRIMLTLTSLAIIIGVSAACCGYVIGTRLRVNAHSNSNSIDKEQKYYTSIEIQKGDSLWSIAQSYMNDDYESIEDYVNELKTINKLNSDCINEAEYLTVAYYL